MNKVEFFFRLLRGLYGAAKMSTSWPTDLDMQLVQKLWENDINKHSEEELRGAIENAKKQMQNCEEEWQWPNIGLILSGAKKPRENSPEVKSLLSYEETPESKAARKEMGKLQIASIKSLL